MRSAEYADVSVVIPTRDRRALLAQTVAHVLAQRSVAIELVVVDDGSEDGTSEWVQGIDDERVSLVRGGGRGVAAARNLGLAQAQAPLVAFNDDDDLWAPDKLVTQVAALQRCPRARWICSAAVRVNDDLRVIAAERVWTHGDVSTVALAGNPVPGGASGVVADTGLVREVGGFDERFHILADWDLWARLAMESEMAAVDRPLHAYRIHSGGMSSGVATTRREIALFEEKYADERRRRSVSLNMPRLNYWMADRAQRSGDRLGAAGAFIQGRSIVGRSRGVTRAVEALLWPSGYRARDRRRGRQVDAVWLAEVFTWLPVDPARSLGGVAAAGLVGRAPQSRLPQLRSRRRVR